jgi:hypothetical protein
MQIVYQNQLLKVPQWKLTSDALAFLVELISAACCKSVLSKIREKYVNVDACNFVSEKNLFIHFPVVPYIKYCPAVVATYLYLAFLIETRKCIPVFCSQFQCQVLVKQTVVPYMYMHKVP